METFEHAGHTIHISRDEYARNPSEMSEYDTGLFLIGWHKSFYVLPPTYQGKKFDPKDIVSQYKKTHWMFPVEAYIHSGVVLALSGQGNFCDRQWDVSQCGMIFVAKKEWPRSAKAIKAAMGLLEEWNQYLSGDVWSYNIESLDEACSGFYGKENCIDEAKDLINRAVERARKKACEPNECSQL